MTKPIGLLRLLVPSTPRGAVLAICAAAVFLVLETVLVVLLKQVQPADPIGVVYAALMAMALLANFIVGVVATRKAVLALNASRARIVAASDTARRQVERNLHDGAQQRLVASTLRVHVAEQLVPVELDDLKKELAQVASELSDISTELQHIADAIAPIRIHPARTTVQLSPVSTSLTTASAIASRR